MDTKLPAFLFYANDFIGSTAHYEVETVGAYIRLLCFQWVNGAIPNSKKQIQGIISCSADKFEETWNTLLPKFEKKSNGFLNKKLEKIRQEAIEFRKNRSKAGKKGMDHRWNKDNTVNNSVITQPITKGITNDNLSSSSSLSSSKSISSSKKTPAKAGTPQAEFVKKWSNLYESETGRPFKKTNVDFINASKLLNRFGDSEVLFRAKLLFELCQKRSAWFTKGGMADFTIGKLSSQWNSLIKGVDDGKQAGISEKELAEFVAGRE